MERAIAETDRRRAIQVAHNIEHDITPLSIVKAVYQMESHRDQQSLRAAAFQEAAGLPPDEVLRLAKDVEKEMLRAAKRPRVRACCRAARPSGRAAAPPRGQGRAGAGWSAGAGTAEGPIPPAVSLTINIASTGRAA